MREAMPRSVRFGSGSRQWTRVAARWRWAVELPAGGLGSKVVRGSERSRSHLCMRATWADSLSEFPEPG
jgi:hypothetical protein